MTAFMERVAELVSATGASPVLPRTEDSQVRTSIAGEGRQVATRALAEQLVCEANAVLAAEGDHLSLADQVGPDVLAFTVSYRNREAHVSTRFEAGRAIGSLLVDGVPAGAPHELVDPEAVQDLLLLLLRPPER